MTAADITLIAFTLCNSFRLLAYVPQIAKAARDPAGAQAVSFTTWGLFLFANVSAVAYALVNQEDWTMAAMFLGNAAGCAAILMIGAWKRSQWRGDRLLGSGTELFARGMRDALGRWLRGVAEFVAGYGQLHEHPEPAQRSPAYLLGDALAHEDGEVGLDGERGDIRGRGTMAGGGRAFGKGRPGEA